SRTQASPDVVIGLHVASVSLPMTFEYRLEADATTPDLRHGCLSKARAASPLDLCHFASHDIDFERSVAPDIACPSLERNFVMSGQQRRPTARLGITGRGCDLALLAVQHEGIHNDVITSAIWAWFVIRISAFMGHDY